MAGVNPDEVAGALRDADFPAGKDELIQAAQQAGASEQVIAALRAIPPVDYRNRDEVIRSVPTDPAGDLDLSPAQRAGQKREAHRKPRRLAEYLREVPKPPVEEELDG